MVNTCYKPVCPVFLVTPLITGVDYLPFTRLVSGLRLINTDDGCSNLIYMNSGLPFGEDTESALRVSSSTYESIEHEMNVCMVY